VHNGSSQES